LWGCSFPGIRRDGFPQIPLKYTCSDDIPASDLVTYGFPVLPRSNAAWTAKVENPLAAAAGR